MASNRYAPPEPGGASTAEGVTGDPYGSHPGAEAAAPAAPYGSYDSFDSWTEFDPFAASSSYPTSAPTSAHLTSPTVLSDGHAASAGTDFGDTTDFGADLGAAHTDLGAAHDAAGPAYYGPEQPADEPRTEWNPSTETLRPVRGRHRVRQRGGTMARSRAVLGVGVMAAVGAGGMATASENGASSVPGMDAASDKVRSIPDQIPILNSFLGSDSSDDELVAVAPFTGGAVAEAEESGEQVDAGEALRARILAQADQQDATVEAAERAAAFEQAAAGAQQEAADHAAEERRAEEERQRRIEEERERRAEEERLRQLRASFTLPLSDYRLSSGFGESGSMWQSNHTGTDFAAPSGTPVENIHTGTVTEAAWAGSYGYRIIVEQQDGTEVWYCHLSSMSVSAGQEVTTEDVIGTVGSTGNSSGPHLHLEVRPGGGDPIDPLSWLRGKGLSV